MEKRTSYVEISVEPGITYIRDEGTAGLYTNLNIGSSVSRKYWPCLFLSQGIKERKRANIYG